MAIILIVTPFVLISCFIIVSWINHHIQLSKEDNMFIPKGELVKVDEHYIHVYTEGDGEDTLVFMSGGRTSSPMLDFKSLYSLLKDQDRIVVIEKAGYRFSDITESDRDMDTILSETREALSSANNWLRYGNTCSI